MADRKLRIGRISFSNLFPIFRVLEESPHTHLYEFVEGHPAELNRTLRDGKLDLSPSSSVEYLRNSGLYTLIPGNSISSRGPVRSIILLSRVPIGSLGGREIAVTHKTASSSALLEVLLRKFHGISAALVPTSAPLEEAAREHDAYLSIGDEALVAQARALPMGACPGEEGCRLGSIGDKTLRIYDLGDLWYRETGLPFVFALWIVRRDAAAGKKDLLDVFSEDLDRARSGAVARLEELAAAPGLPLPTEEMIPYWRGILYGLDENCLRGLEAFRASLSELGLLS
ncbi:MAG: menaquinone biosynthesis protein [Nitrospirota bacterium]|jgi:chorismate dehydratase